MNVADRQLSKSLFLRGEQCTLSLYFSAFEPEQLGEPGADARARMEVGRAVGRAAHGLFPGGVFADPMDLAGLLAARPPAIFEPTLISGGLSARVDILAPARRGWRLIEVKSSTSVKPEHLPDVAYQLHLARRCGIQIERVEILHLNRDYLRRGDLDLHALFAAEDVTAQAEDLLPAISLAAAAHLRILEEGGRPPVAIGPHCLDPRRCDGITSCWAGVPSGSVLEIAHLTWKKKFALYHRGVVRIDDVPPEAEIPPRSRRHVDAHQGRSAILDRDGLRAFVDSLTYPVYLLDFETVGPAIPRWEASRPYDTVPFQYSLHVLRHPGAEPEHSEFLAAPGPDPRPALLDALLPATAGEGTILAFHMPFELGVMKKLAEAFPARRAEIERRIPRMDDLIQPFRAWHYWLPAMGGSFSIKSVAPAIAPDLTYEGLEVADGLAASRTYEELLNGLRPETAERMQQALRAYCERDTLAMVRVLEAVRQAGES